MMPFERKKINNWRKIYLKSNFSKQKKIKGMHIFNVYPFLLAFMLKNSVIFYLFLKTISI